MSYYHFHVFIRGKKKGAARPTLYSGLVQVEPDALDQPNFYKDLISSAFKGKIDSSVVAITSTIVDHDARYDFARKFSFKIVEKFKHNRTGAFLLTEVDFKSRDFGYGTDTFGHYTAVNYKYSSLYSHVNYLEEED